MRAALAPVSPLLSVLHRRAFQRLQIDARRQKSADVTRLHVASIVRLNTRNSNCAPPRSYSAVIPFTLHFRGSSSAVGETTANHGEEGKRGGRALVYTTASHGGGKARYPSVVSVSASFDRSPLRAHDFRADGPRAANEFRVVASWG